DASASALLVVTSDVATVVLAPPLACTVPSRGSEVDVAGADSVVEPPEPDAEVVAVAMAVFDNVESCWASVGSDPELVPVDPAVSGAATATPGDVATAAPMPNAIAKAPTRPT